MEIGPLKQGHAVKFPQAKNEVLPSLPCRLLAIGPGSSGKTTALITLITDPRFFRGKFTKIVWCSPSATVDPALDALREYVRDELQQNQEEEPTFHDFVNVPFLEAMVAKARKVSEFLKARKAKQPGFNVLFVIDDLSDVKTNLPAVTRFVNACFVKNRHWGCSIILATQRLRLPLITPTVRVNTTAVMCWRLRNQSDLWDGLIYEYSALTSKESLYAAYKAAVGPAFGFLYIDMLSKDVNHMFFSSFTHRFLMEPQEENNTMS